MTLTVTLGGGSSDTIPAAEAITTSREDPTEAPSAPGDEDTVVESEGTPVRSVSGGYPDVPQEQMRRDILEVLREHHEALARGDTETAWQLFTPRRKQRFINQEGRTAWDEKNIELGRLLDFSDASVELVRPLDREDGEATVRVNRLRYRGSCPLGGTDYSGVTWVRWDADAGRWLYEPGYSTTDASGGHRRAEWESQPQRLFGGRCVPIS